MNRGALLSLMLIAAGAACYSGSRGHAPGTGGSSSSTDDASPDGTGGGAADAGGSGGVTVVGSGGTGGLNGSGGRPGSGGANSGGSGGLNGSGGSPGSGGANSGGTGGLNGSGGSGVAGATGSTGGTGAGGAVGATAFSSVLSVFKARCVQCHSAGAVAVPKTSLYLTADVAYSALVSVASADEPCGGTFVVPGKSSQSYLVQKLTEASPCDGMQMPMQYEGPFVPLDSTQLATIVNWIDEGAPP